jgi:PAS domain S-box-containing protein
MSKIMIVDDDVIIAEELKEILTIDGYDVVKALYSAEEALECASTLRPDLILMDIGFSGGMDGITAARKIKEALDIPVMFFTGHSGIEIVERAKDLEPVGYVVKPFHEAQVTSNVRLAFSQIKTKKELERAHGRLEKRVRERTKSLAEANVKLKWEVRERKSAQESLAQSEKTIKGLLATPAAFALVTNVDGDIVYANETAISKFKGSPEEIFSSNILDLLPRLGKTAESQRYRMIRETIETGMPFRFEDDFDGIWYDIVITPIFEKEGRVGQFAFLGRDISERKRMEVALAESEGHLRSLMENAGDFVVYRLAYDKSAPILLRVVFVSPSITDIMGVSEPMNYENWFKNIHPDDLQRMVDANYRAWETNRFEEKVRIFHPREKTWKWIHAISTGIQVEDVRPTYINGLMIDITREKAFEEELKKRDRELKEKATHLEEANTALRVLLRKRDQDKVEFEEKILANVRLLIEPHLESLKNSGPKSSQREHLRLLESSLKEIISPFSQRLTSKYVGLTPGELEVAYLVKEGRRTKDIAQILNLSDKTIEDYRKQLRTKLGIKNKRINLRTHLLSLQ